MKNNMLKTTIITMILLISCFTSIATISVKAQTNTQPAAGPLPSGVTPSVTIKPEGYLAVNPSPIGVGQALLVNVWNQPPINVQRIFHKNQPNNRNEARRDKGHYRSA